MIRLILVRLLLIAVPFLVYGVWRRAALRSGRPMGSTPWAWLVAIGALLAALSLMATTVVHTDNRGQVYVPAQALPDGRVSPAHFRPAETRP